MYACGREGGREAQNQPALHGKSNMSICARLKEEGRSGTLFGQGFTAIYCGHVRGGGSRGSEIKFRLGYMAIKYEHIYIVYISIHL